MSEKSQKRLALSESVGFDETREDGNLFNDCQARRCTASRPRHAAWQFESRREAAIGALRR